MFVFQVWFLGLHSIKNDDENIVDELSLLVRVARAHALAYDCPKPGAQHSPTLHTQTHFH